MAGYLHRIFKRHLEMMIFKIRFLSDFGFKLKHSLCGYFPSQVQDVAFLGKQVQL